MTEPSEPDEQYGLRYPEHHPNDLGPPVRVPAGEPWHYEPRDQDRTPQPVRLDPEVEQLIRETAERMVVAVYGWPFPHACADARMALRALLDQPLSST